MAGGQSSRWWPRAQIWFLNGSQFMPEETWIISFPNSKELAAFGQNVNVIISCSYRFSSYLSRPALISCAKCKHSNHNIELTPRNLRNASHASAECSMLSTKTSAPKAEHVELSHFPQLHCFSAEIANLSRFGISTILYSLFPFSIFVVVNPLILAHAA